MKKRTLKVEIAAEYADKFVVGGGLTLESAWYSGLDASAQWVVTEVTHTLLDQRLVVTVDMHRWTKH